MYTPGYPPSYSSSYILLLLLVLFGDFMLLLWVLLPGGQTSVEVTLSEATNSPTVMQMLWILELWRSKSGFMEVTFQPNYTVCSCHIDPPQDQ